MTSSPLFVYASDSLDQSQLVVNLAAAAEKATTAAVSVICATLKTTLNVSRDNETDCMATSYTTMDVPSNASNSSTSSTLGDMYRSVVGLGPVRQVTFVLYLVTFAVGLIGNTLTIVAIAVNKRMKRSAATCFMLNLAIADDLFILSLPFKAHSTKEATWVFGAAACKVLSVMYGVNCYASIFTMTAMSVDRYLAVVRPLSSRQYRTTRHAAGICIATWAICAVIMLPDWLYTDIKFDIRSNRTIPVCRRNWPQKSFNQLQLFSTLFEIIAGFFIPVIVMAVGYARLLRGLIYATRSVSEMDSASAGSYRRGGGSRRQGSASELQEATGGGPGDAVEAATLSVTGRPSSSRLLTTSSSRRSENSWKAFSSSTRSTTGVASRASDRTRQQIRRVTAMVFSVTAAFVVCWVPYRILQLQHVYRSLVYAGSGYVPPPSEVLLSVVLNTVAEALIFVSSCCNPFIYCLSSSNFIGVTTRTCTLPTRRPTSCSSLPQSSYRLCNNHNNAAAALPTGGGRAKDTDGWIKMNEL